MKRMMGSAFGASLLAGLVVLVAQGCGGNNGTADAGEDSGFIFHGGGGNDAGQDGGTDAGADAGNDAGNGGDAGQMGDGGEVIPDGGETMDAGETTDAGSITLPTPHEAETLVGHTNDDTSTAEALVTIPNSTTQHIYGLIGDDTDQDVYSFTAQPGQVLRVTVTALQGADYQSFATISDDQFTYSRNVPTSATSPGTATREFVITAPGNYFVTVEDARNADGTVSAGGPTAGYEVKIDVVTTTPTALTLPTSNLAGSIAANGAVSAYSFSGTATQALQAAVTASQLATPSDVDTVLVLLDPMGQVLRFNEDIDPGSGNTDSAITAELPAIGTYQLIVDYSDIVGSNRAFTLDASTFTPAPGDTCTSAITLTPAVTLMGNTSTFHDFYDPGSNTSAACSNDLFVNYPGQDVVYSIAVPAGKTLSVTVTPDMVLDPAVVITPSCADVGASCVAAADLGSNGDPDTATFTNSGTSLVNVFVIVDSYDPTSPGAYGIQATIQ